MASISEGASAQLSSRQGRRTSPDALLLAMLLLLATVPYLGILWNDFCYAYDDYGQIIENPYVHSLGHLKEAVTTNVWSFKGSHRAPSYYRPVMTLGFLLCYRVFGPLAYGFHLASLLLHGAVVAVLFLLAMQLFGDRSAAFAAAGWFALHPIHTENLAWISDMNDLEMTFFGLLAFWCFVRVAAPGGGRRPWMLAAMTVSFLLAMLSKEQAVLLPLLATIYEHFYRQDRQETQWGQKLWRYAPLWLVSFAYILLRVRFLGGVARNPDVHHLTRTETFLSAVSILGQYLAKLIWPAHLQAFYPFHPSTKLLDVHVLAGVSALVLCALAFLGLWKHQRSISFGIPWLLVMLAPVLNARLMTTYVFGERYLYLPSVGFCLVAGWASAALWRATWQRSRHGWRLPALAGFSLLVGLCVLRIATRVPAWHNDITLLKASLADTPKNTDQFPLHHVLGQAYWLHGDLRDAEREWIEALRLVPDNPEIPYKLGVICAQQKRYDEAVELFRRAISLGPRQFDAHLNLGVTYAEMGKLDLAEQEFRASVDLAPLNFSAHNVLGKLYYDSGRLHEAEEQFRQSLDCEPNLAAYDYLGYIYESWKDTERAEKGFKAALAFNPEDSHAHFHLGLIYAAAGRKEQAVEQLQAALRADPDNPEIHKALEQLTPGISTPTRH